MTNEAKAVKAPTHPLEVRGFESAIFDLDGVITQTSSVHASAWKQLFDDFLKAHAQTEGIPFEPFTLDGDYAQYVSGKPRYEGLSSFLASRGISLPMGSPGDTPEQKTVYGLGQRKNDLYLEYLEKNGVSVFESTVRAIQTFRKNGVKVGVISASKNCRPVLAAANLTELFDTRVDGLDAEEQGLKGKPQPDVFLRAAQNLGAHPEHSIVFEDAIAGVAAAVAGGFGTVVGIDREGIAEALQKSGATYVVKDLEEIDFR
jgi:alpha,alpha-trehalase